MFIVQLTICISMQVQHFSLRRKFREISLTSMTSLDVAVSHNPTQPRPSNANVVWLDTFASKTAAIEDETADNSVGNVTGSNAVNVFLGIGIAWSMAAIYHETGCGDDPRGPYFFVPVGRWLHHFQRPTIATLLIYFSIIYYLYLF